MTRSPIRIVALLLLVFVGGLGLLYAYRSQSPAMQTIPVTQAASEIQAGQVTEVLIEENRATLTLTDGNHQITNMAFGDETLLRAVVTRNQSDPAHPVQLRTQPAPPNLFPPLLALTPLLLLIALVLLAAYAFARARAPDPYERLARLADLRDRNVLTEDEFQREKRKVFG
jgi:ATP-dependent Zn protease